MLHLSPALVSQFSELLEYVISPVKNHESQQHKHAFRRKGKVPPSQFVRYCAGVNQNVSAEATRTTQIYLG